MTAPLPFQWDGEAMIPKRGFAAKCDEEFIVGETYALVPHEERSMRSHRHYFACVRTAWLSLPEALAGDLPTPEHLRKFALIKAGYCDQERFACASNRDAIKASATIQTKDDFALIDISGKVVTIWTAKSQSVKAMGKEAFNESKAAVLELLESLIGAPLDECEAA